MVRAQPWTVCSSVAGETPPQRKAAISGQYTVPGWLWQA